MPTILFEIGTEELPASFVLPALKQLEVNASKALSEARIKNGAIHTYATPRRLALVIKDVADRQADVTLEVRGPKKEAAYDVDGQPTKAAEGFAKSHGVSVDSLIVSEAKGTKFVFVTRHEIGRNTSEVLSEELPKLALGLTFPKQMRWGQLDIRFGRPIRWIVALMNDEVIPLDLAGIQSDRMSNSDRLSNKSVSLESADSYLERLEKSSVIADHVRRRTIIQEDAEAEAVKLGGHAMINDSLLDEVNFLVEYPTVLSGNFDKEYLKLPSPVLTEVMGHHQRYFPVLDTNDELMPCFITICNGKRTELDAIQRGNEKVLAARLADAKFFFDEDAKESLERYVPKLNGLVFQRGLGTMLDKTRRVEKIVCQLADALNVGPDIKQIALRAAELSKADLVTKMVVELPELQGVIGSEYANQSGESERVAEAISGHYTGRNPGQMPSNSVPANLVELADCADTLCTCFDHGLIPTGSEDPLALRRAAQAVINILKHSSLHIGISTILSKSLSTISEAGLLERPPEDTQSDLLAFIKARIDTHQDMQTVPDDLRQAVLEVGFDDVPDAFVRASVMKELRDTDRHFQPSVIAFSRVTNILKSRPTTPLNTELFDDPLEKQLHSSFTSIASELPLPLRGKDYSSYKNSFLKLAELKPAIDGFFGVGSTGVLVMHDDEQLRNNRLALLQEIECVLLQIADFSKIIT